MWNVATRPTALHFEVFKNKLFWQMYTSYQSTALNWNFTCCLPRFRWTIVLVYGLKSTVNRLLYVGYIPRRRLSPFQKLPPAISVPAYVLHVALWNLLWILSISHLANQSFSDVRPKVSEGSVATHTCGVHGWILDKKTLLQIYWRISQWKKVENWLRINKLRQNEVHACRQPVHERQ